MVCLVFNLFWAFDRNFYTATCRASSSSFTKSHLEVSQQEQVSPFKTTLRTWLWTTSLNKLLSSSKGSIFCEWCVRQKKLYFELHFIRFSQFQRVQPPSPPPRTEDVPSPAAEEEALWNPTTALGVTEEVWGTAQLNSWPPSVARSTSWTKHSNHFSQGRLMAATAHSKSLQPKWKMEGKGGSFHTFLALF